MEPLLKFYILSFAVTVLSTLLTSYAIASPHWLTARFEIDGQKVDVAYGLHEKCSSLTGKCVPFPDIECTTGDREFCNIWRTTSFMMWFSLVILGPTLISYVTLLFGSRQLRETGWKMVSILLSLVVFVQLVAMSVVVYMLNTDKNFQYESWRVGCSWAADTASWIIMLALVVFTLIVGKRTVPSYLRLNMDSTGNVVDRYRYSRDIEVH
ncbi:hypothetical protein V1511DRAFT_506437 [Dipodascopsis uninucleata]